MEIDKKMMRVTLSEEEFIRRLREIPSHVLVIGASVMDKDYNNYLRDFRTEGSKIKVEDVSKYNELANALSGYVKAVQSEEKGKPV